MNIKNFLCVTPFASFIFGYLVMQQLFRIPELCTPHLVGQQIHTILPIITQYNLNLRLIDQKEEADLPEGIILNQTPSAGTIIKSNQPLFIVTTKKPIIARAPHCVGSNSDQLHLQLQENGIQSRMYQLPHPYPEKICFAQSPQTNEPLDKNRLILYISAGNNKPIIWPNFSNMPLRDVITFLDNYHIEPTIMNDYLYNNYENDEYIVVEQRPFAGTLLTLDENKPLSVQLRVRKQS
jgi:eukaryotic-like serine/threonine-protein kinase